MPAIGPTVIARSALEIRTTARWLMQPGIGVRRQACRELVLSLTSARRATQVAEALDDAGAKAEARKKPGCQRRQAPSDTRPRSAKVAPGDRHAGRCLATLSDGRGCMAMQEVKVGSGWPSQTMLRHRRRGPVRKHADGGGQRRAVGS